MGLEDFKENATKRDVARQIFDNEIKTIEAIGKLDRKDYGTFINLGMLLSAVGAQNIKDSDSKGIAVKGGDLKNKEGKTITMFLPKRELPVVVLFREIGEDTRVGITYFNGEITYSFSSRETGTIDLATVSQNELKAYNYGTDKDKKTYRLVQKNPYTSDISQVKEGASLRDVVCEHIKTNPTMEPYSLQIMSAFDDILSLDENRNIQPLSEESISRLELVRKNDDLKKENEELEAENRKLEAENEELEAKNSKLNGETEELKKQIDALKKELSESRDTNKRLSSIIEALKERVSRIPFFGKKALRDIKETEKQLPATHSASSDSFKEQYTVNPDSLNMDYKGRDTQSVQKNERENDEQDFLI